MKSVLFFLALATVIAAMLYVTAVSMSSNELQSQQADQPDRVINPSELRSFF